MSSKRSMFLGVPIRKRRAIAPIPSLRTVLKVLGIGKRSVIAILGAVLYFILYLFPEFIPSPDFGGFVFNTYQAENIMLTLAGFVIVVHLLYMSIQARRLSSSRAKSAVVRAVGAGSGILLTVWMFFGNVGGVHAEGGFLQLPQTGILNTIANLFYDITTVPVFALGQILFGKPSPQNYTPVFAGFVILFLLWAFVFALLMRAVKTQ